MNRVYGCMDDEVDQLPGFRFHPTDEELVGFYLRRKVDKKAFTIELIKQMDIYKYDPWDLPRTNTVGDKEWYFFCKRGRKYRNSIRPNRVTGSGFWKATGIDRPVYSLGGEGHDCIGLKKTLVYYRGSAGKGAKTDWMMHEFRLPTNTNTSNPANAKTSTALQEAEVWTLCRIFKRTVTNQKCRTPERKEISTKHNSNDKNPKKCNLEVKNEEDFLNFGASFICRDQEMTPVVNHMINEKNQLHVGQLSFIAAQASSMAASPSTFSNLDVNEFFRYENWDEFTSFMEFSMDPFLL